MAEYEFMDWVKFGLTWLGVFAFGGGIIAMTTGGFSGRGFFEGMWKGVEWFFIVGGGIAVLYGAWALVISISSSIN